MKKLLILLTFLVASSTASAQCDCESAREYYKELPRKERTKADRQDRRDACFLQRQAFWSMFWQEVYWNSYYYRPIPNHRYYIIY